MTDKKILCKGLRENGKWEEFHSSSITDALPMNSGYERVVVVGSGEELNDKTEIPRDEH